MSVNTFFNETELAIFCRQTNFTFGDCRRSADGVIFAVDCNSGQVFIGDDLLKSNVHRINSIEDVSLLPDHTVRVSFKGSSSVEFDAGGEDAEAIAGELQALAGLTVAQDESGPQISSSAPEDGADEIQEEEELPEYESLCVGNCDLTEVYSRLANTGRTSAVDYLVCEVGMSMNEADELVDSMVGKDELVESVPEPECYADGTMRKQAVLDVVRSLKPGDRIHLEYKPLLGKLRVYEAEYVKINIDIWTRNFQLSGAADDFDTLMDDVASDIFDYLNLVILCKEYDSDIECKLKRVTVLKKI